MLISLIVTSLKIPILNKFSCGKAGHLVAQFTRRIKNDKGKGYPAKANYLKEMNITPRAYTLGVTNTQ